MRRTLVHGVGTGPGVDPPDGGDDTRTDRPRARAAAFDARAASPDVDDGRDIFGDAGLGRVEDGRSGPPPRSAEHGPGDDEPA